MFFTSSWACVLHYTTFTQGLLSGLDLIIYFLLFIMHFVYLPSLQETECLFGNFLLSLTVNDREGSQGWGGLSTGTRAKGYHAHHSWVGGNKQSSFAFFLDDKYVR